MGITRYKKAPNLADLSWRTDSGTRISMATACRILKDKTGFDAWEVRDKIREMGGRATLLDVVCRYGYEKDILAIFTRLIQPPNSLAAA